MCGKPSFLVLLNVFTLVISSASLSAEQSVDKLKQTWWYQPKLVVDESNFCDSLRGGIERLNLSEPKANGYARGHFSIYNISTAMPELTPLKAVNDFYTDSRNPQDASEKDLTITPLLVNDVEVYVKSYEQTGCGSACNLYQALPNHSTDYSQIDVQAFPVSVADLDSGVFKRIDDSYWLIQQESQKYVHAYQLTAQAKWQKQCSIKISPLALSNDENDNNINKVLGALENFEEASFAVSGGYGSYCGSSQSGWRGRNYFSDNIRQLVYSPWPLLYSANVDDEYVKLNTFLNSWSSEGIYERHAYEKFKGAIKLAQDELSAFYQARNGWSVKESDAIAEKGLVASTLSLLSNNSSNNQELTSIRLQLLKGDLTDDLRAKKSEIVAWEDKLRNGESFLNLAIESPAITQWLLSMGLNPNKANTFGKTPLMYAVQHNQYETVRLLLEADANPNSKTRAYQGCYYSITTGDVTPLHYAIRNASLMIIELLLNNGAVANTPTIGSNLQWRERGTTPLDWLAFYTNPENNDVNQNISEDDIKTITRLLTTSVPIASQAHSYKKTLAAESAYQNGELRKALKLIDIAIMLDPKNERAWSDKSLISYKLKDFNTTVEAAKRLIEYSEDPQLVASAWFNIGLACTAEPNCSFYNGRFNQRVSSHLAAFINSYETKPSNVRLEKILLSAEHQSDQCQLRYGSQKVDVFIQEDVSFPPTTFRNRRLHLYSLTEGPLTMNAQKIVNSFMAKSELVFKRQYENAAGKVLTVHQLISRSGRNSNWCDTAKKYQRYDMLDDSFAELSEIIQKREPL